MKLTRENLKGFKFTRNGNYTDGISIYYLNVCEKCGKICLVFKRGRFCDRHCAMLGVTPTEVTRKKLRKNHADVSGKSNPMYGKCGELSPVYGRCGELHPNYKRIVSEETRKKLSEIRIGKKFKPLSKEHKKKLSKAKKGKYTKENHPRWLGGISDKGYCPIFSDKEFKQIVKDRDGNICLNCNKTKEQNGRELCIHHIDYDKMNCELNNLVTVCQSCNSTANSDREWHTEWYQLMLSKRYEYTYNKMEDE